VGLQFDSYFPPQFPGRILRDAGGNAPWLAVLSRKPEEVTILSPPAKMKTSIEWHESNLIARRNTLERTRKEIERMQEAFSRQEKDIAFLDLQIHTAKEKGKTEFDDERFLVQRK
jgi:hypothetical protein